jgi:flagellar biosynthesis/type III secretory pathway protein FliH
MMNSPSDVNEIGVAPRSTYPVAAYGAGTLSAFVMPESSVVPYEFRCLTGEDLQVMDHSDESRSGHRSGADGSRSASQYLGKTGSAIHLGVGNDGGATQALLRSAVDAARQDGHQQGELQGRSQARTEMEAELSLSVAQERRRLADSLDHFRGVKDRYFVEVEQEVVRLALAIAARVLHREAQLDPLLLTGVVRVALEKMADRSSVVLRVTGADVAAWEDALHSTEASERPRVVEDARLERGECVLETKMGTVELGVRVQLEEIEKGFFDLLNHRPVE